MVKVYSAIGAILTLFGVIAASTCSVVFLYQPKMPKNLQK